MNSAAAPGPGEKNTFDFTRPHLLVVGFPVEDNAVFGFDYLLVAAARFPFHQFAVLASRRPFALAIAIETNPSGRSITFLRIQPIIQM